MLFRALGATRYGIWSFCYMFVGYLTLFDLGLGATVERLVARAHAADDAAEIERVLNHGSACALALAGVLQVAALALPIPPIAGVDVRPLAWVLPSCLLVSLLAAISGAGLSGIQALTRLNQVRTQMNAVGTALVVAALALGVRRVEVLLATYSVGLAGAALAAWVSLRAILGRLRFAPLRFEPRLMREFVRFGGVVQAAVCGPQVADQFFRILLGVRFGPAWMGCYDLGSRAAVVVRSFTGTLLLAMVPFGVQQQLLGGALAVERLHRITLKYTALFLLPASALALSQSRLLISAWLGDSADTANVLFVFRVFIVVNAAAGLAGPIAMLGRAAGTPAVEASVVLTFSGLGLLVAWTAPEAGVVIVGFGAASVAGACLVWWILSRRGLGGPGSGGTLLRTAVLSAVTVTLGEGLRRLLPAPGGDVWRQMVTAGISIGLPLAVAFPLAWVSGVLSVGEREFWKAFRPRPPRESAR